MDKNTGALDLHNSEVFSQVFLETNTQVYRYLYGMTGGPAEAVEDLLAETYSRAWQARARFHGDDKAVLFWLLKIARNQVFDAYRRKRTGIAASSTDETAAPQLLAPETGPEERLIDLQAREEVWKTLQQFSDGVKEMLILRYFMDWQVKQIARYLGKKETADTMAIQRALAAFPRHPSEIANHPERIQQNA